MVTVWLSRFNINDEQATVIAQILEHDTVYTTLVISWNQIGNAGAFAFAKAIRNNYTLTYLDIHANMFGKIGTLAILDALETNYSLIFIQFDSIWKAFNNDSDTMCDTIASWFERGREITARNRLFRIRLREMCRESKVIYLGFGSRRDGNMPIFIRQLLIFKEEFSEQQNIRLSDFFLRNVSSRIELKDALRVLKDPKQIDT